MDTYYEDLSITVGDSYDRFVDECMARAAANLERARWFLLTTKTRRGVK